tara:strand:- start:6336 stop:6881 length:546 start_codon:yes stop_codon:yes gene_type:complete
MRKIAKITFTAFLLISLCACSAGLSAGLEAFQSPDGRYGFFYPTGWTRVSVKEGPEVVYHDLINSDETLSLVVSNVNQSVELEELGTPREVGETLINKIIAPEGSGREVDLVKADKREQSDHVFYDLEYKLNLDGKTRHEIATVVIDRGSLYTFAVGTNDNRWKSVSSLFSKIIKSFSFFI